MCTREAIAAVREGRCPSPAGRPLPRSLPTPPQTAAKPASFTLDGFPWLELYGKGNLFSGLISSTQRNYLEILLCGCVSAWFVSFLPTGRIAMVFFLHSPVDRWDP